MSEKGFLYYIFGFDIPLTVVFCDDFTWVTPFFFDHSRTLLYEQFLETHQWAEALRALCRRGEEDHPRDGRPLLFLRS